MSLIKLDIRRKDGMDSFVLRVPSQQSSQSNTRYPSWLSRCEDLTRRLPPHTTNPQRDLEYLAEFHLDNLCFIFIQVGSTKWQIARIY